MFRSTGALAGAAVPLAFACLSAAPAAAQGYSAWCLDTVDSFCNGEAVSTCFGFDSGFWSALPNECVGEVQSMIEDEAAAYQGDGMADGNYDPDGYDAYQGDGMADGNYDPGANDSAAHNSSYCLQTIANLCGESWTGDCFADGSMWSYVPQECTSTVDAMVQDESSGMGQSDGMADGNYDPNGGSDAYGSIMVDAFSWGGNLRTGPGGDYASIRVLPEGESITVLDATDVMFQGYPWFRVLTGWGEGYTWGGIICTRDQWVDGISGYC